MADEQTLEERVAAVQRWLAPFVLSGAAKAADHAKVLRDLQAEIERRITAAISAEQREAALSDIEDSR